MYQALLIKYAEIGIKGKNRHLFEDRLMHQMAVALRRVDGSFETVKEMGRIFVMPHGECDKVGAIEALQNVFGITGICPVLIV